MDTTYDKLGPSDALGRYDRVPGVPLIGFMAGAAVSLALWAAISWAAFLLIV